MPLPDILKAYMCEDVRILLMDNAVSPSRVVRKCGPVQAWVLSGEGLLRKQQGGTLQDPPCNRKWS